jgi:uncharacterized protein (DUF1778 family)
MSATASRTEKVDLRLTRDAKALLQTAARASHRSLSEFVLESALARAEAALPDRQHFGLDSDQWDRFQAALDAPPRPMPNLANLLAEASPFESQKSK